MSCHNFVRGSVGAHECKKTKSGNPPNFQSSIGQFPKFLVGRKYSRIPKKNNWSVFKQNQRNCSWLIKIANRTKRKQ